MVGFGVGLLGWVGMQWVGLDGVCWLIGCLFDCLFSCLSVCVSCSCLRVRSFVCDCLFVCLCSL